MWSTRLPLIVLEVLPQSPAEQAGLYEGDHIVQINGRDVLGMTYPECLDLIRDAGESIFFYVLGDLNLVTYNIAFYSVDVETVDWPALHLERSSCNAWKATVAHSASHGRQPHDKWCVCV